MGLESFFAEHDVSFDEARESGALSLAPTREVYFKDGCFDPDRMLEMLREFHDSARDAGYVRTRVIGEMTQDFGFDASLPKPFRKEDLERLLENLLGYNQA